MPTKINWCDETWNPITGCTPISPGCANCYAKKMAQRLKGRYGYPKDKPFRVTLHEDRLNQLVRWKNPRRIFVCSMGDLFHPTVFRIEQAAVFVEMERVERHTYLLLTKRPGAMELFIRTCPDYDYKDWPNLWLGTSCENQEYADKRIPHLLKIPAAVRWLSLEPLLGPIDLHLRKLQCDNCGFGGDDCYECETAHRKSLPTGIHWVVIGCESGPGRRPCKLEWVESIVAQCHAANVPVWVKQIEIDGKVETDMSKFPKELQVRELPI